MVRNIHHINFVVWDLAVAVPTWERILGRRCDSHDRLDGRDVDIARFRLEDMWIVLVQPTGPGAPADFLAANGEGFFMLSFGVDSLDDEIARLGDAMLDGSPRAGLDDWKVQDLDVGQTLGAQVQYTED
ncbi:MAG: VOC family protein [Gammaproteobacteria bacterium]